MNRRVETPDKQSALQLLILNSILTVDMLGSVSLTVKERYALSYRVIAYVSNIVSLRIIKLGSLSLSNIVAVNLNFNSISTWCEDSKLMCTTQHNVICNGIKYTVRSLENGSILSFDL